MHDIVEKYLATWNAQRSDREGLLTDHWSPHVTYVDPQAEVSGHAALHDLIEATQTQFPDFVFSRASEVDAHHRQARFSWGLGPAGEKPVVIGFDVVVLDEDDKIQDVRGFLDTVSPTSMERGYVVGHLSNVTVGPEIRRYMETIESTFEPFGGEWLVHGSGSRPVVLEGPWSADTVIIGFPSIAAARDWYDSPAYQDILDLRTRNAESQVVLLDGVPAGYRAAETIAELFGD